MNVLFLYNNAIIPTRGGVQRVTTVLADYFESKGNTVYYLSLLPLLEGLDVHRQFFLPELFCFTTEGNINYFISFLKEKKIDIVVNQGGTDPHCSSLAYYCRKSQVKLISVVHNSLLASIYNFSSTYSVSWKKMGISSLLPLTDMKYVKYVILWLYKQKYKTHYTRLCANSSLVFLLSDNFKAELDFFIGENQSNNVIGMSNPISFISEKRTTGEKELLYVGRIDTSQKKVDLLLKIWKKIYLVYPDWNLRIVGGGDELDEIMRKSILLNLKNIHFEGFQPPQAYYEKSSIFCMTSSFEGFGIVLIEAMQYGVIPFAFNSFSSITDIIDSDMNGMLINPFDIDAYAEKLIAVMRNEKLREQLSIAAIQKSHKFSIEVIGNKWIETMNSLLKSE